MHKVKTALFMCLAVFLFQGFVFASELPLPADQAFKFNAAFTSPTEIIASWDIAPGYYLYAKRLQITFDAPVLGTIKIPQGEFKFDKAKDERVEVYANQLVVPIQLKQPWLNVRMKVNYQGCSQDGFCYPPIQTAVKLTFGHATADSMLPFIGKKDHKTSTWSFKNLLTDQMGIQTVLAEHSGLFSLLIFFGLGLLLAFTPCVLPMVPILTSIIVGQKNLASPPKAALLAFVYVLGSALMYAIAGVIAALIGSSLQVWLQTPIVIGMMSALFVLLALSLFGFYDLRLPTNLQQHLTLWSNRQQSGTWLGVLIMGMLSALIVSPCVTAPLVGVLLYVSQTGSILLGASALFVLGLGMGLPLILVGASIGWLPKSGPWMEAVKSAFGLLMLAMAIWLSSRILTPFAINLLWIAFLVAMIFFTGVYLPRLFGKMTFHRSLSVVVAACGIVVLMSTLNWKSSTLETHNISLNENHFITVKNSSDIEQQLLHAQALHKLVMLDFYADWCESCISMEKDVFSKPNVKAALRHYLLLRVDLSENTAADEELLKKYNVIAPPTILFFYGEREASDKRIVGEVTAQEFLHRLNLFTAAVCKKNNRVNC